MTGTAQWWASVDLGRAPADAPVAFCADLGPDALLAGYRAGAFPMPAQDEYSLWMNEARYEDLVDEGAVALPAGAGEEAYGVAWWSPDPRPVVPVGGARLGGRLSRRLRNRDDWTTTADKAFGEVVDRCAEGRSPAWLTTELRTALRALHAGGRAHSIEVWENGELVGGAFGVRVGPVLSLDSMMGLRPDAARVAIVDLAQRFGESGGLLLDVQWDSPHVRSLGAVPVPRSEYRALLREGPAAGPPPGEERPASRLG
ncbi:leucyl/phenylalanyl-tRNA--protein transferase [Kitasatospora sp. DSM 101779]|uniref:leucyl/phenylalanyl-tRNA--protein transferase n=1 Tax=Kitasatospora sp. DSM 101779 TaxID=2853165 RepID=UPI0021DA882F|nr:leucyl/phenylalanyl-tRNA--protein transferase [Kitasatospora sp. DSM 101779]MCU7821336.1 leucyl/phenylalanyl-tRNA--protein transferase [Kitasatospora sp. DSM 101779]